MSFLTEYFDEYRPHPIRKTIMCRPENRFAKLEGKWLDPKTGTQEKAWTEEEIEEFIKKTMKSLRGQSCYYNDYCAHLSQEFKTRKFKPREKKRKTCASKAETIAVEEAPPPVLAPKLAMKDTELMKVAKELYERDMDKPTLEPLPTHLRNFMLYFRSRLMTVLEASLLSFGGYLVLLLGYVRPYLYKTGISEYQESIARVAYELIRDDRIPKYYAHNGCRPRWGLPPEGTRQPELDGAPYDGERLY